ncbi:hypothetical protein Acsp03_67990 [Actinomadura sp. NBRC 104412]|uniref:hypothetical protein n=1 Tax=Actinomadura sp. NBRC 104412 TaxID=3032203 RepID=UPI0024A4B6A7|nr:hypothetical protein [Actinomadura sp. NBRC 104412]GLZ09333.1 hypothetical protein Acsp03_67990 [Actinomadura sp. NBRC 104412]
MPADPPVLPEPRSAPRYARRLLTVAGGLALAVLAGGAFTLTHDLLRDFAIAGGAGERWAAAYPIMADALVVIVVLSLIVARDAPWWSRWIRGALLLALLTGIAAIAVQHAVWGYGSLPRTPVRVGVAVAPHVMLLIAIWLWYRMIKHVRTPPKPPTVAPETTQPGTEDPALPEPSPPPLLPTDVEVARAPDAVTPSPSAQKAATTQPDIIMPPHPDQPPEEESEESPAPDRDADNPSDLPIWNWDPPSGSYRSSPTPPDD